MTSDSLLDGHLHRHCGGRYARASETVTIRVSGMSAVVERTFFRCDRCGDERRTVEQREQAEQAAVAAMRDEHGLLKAKEIRQRRERLGLTAAQFGDLIFGVPKGIVEGWEKGRYLQNPQVDALIRSLDDPETLQRRAARGGVALPPPPGSEPAVSEAAESEATIGAASRWRRIRWRRGGRQDGRRDGGRRGGRRGAAGRRDGRGGVVLPCRA